MMFSRKRMTGSTAVGMGGALVLTACGGEDQDLTGGDEGGGEDAESLEFRSGTEPCH